MPSVFIHDDSCGMFLDADGDCPVCRIHPDTQSTALVQIHEGVLDKLRSEGRTLLGPRRIPIGTVRSGLSTVVSVVDRRRRKEQEERAALDRKIIARAKHLTGEEE